MAHNVHLIEHISHMHVDAHRDLWVCVLLLLNEHLKYPLFIGAECQIQIDECESSPCIHGVCHDAINSYNCTCDSGWTSSNCDVDIDECIDDDERKQCENNAKCENTDGDYRCHCDEYYSGILGLEIVVCGDPS